MQIDDIKELMDKMSQTGLTVLEFESEGSRLRMERAPQVVSAEMPVSQISPGLPQPATVAASTSAEPPADEKEGQLVLSPVVGIFYAAGSPDSDPFVKIGAPVEKGTPLCIIEAMKLMNEVTSAWDGIVLEILVENGQRVEFGQPLMRIGGN
ncbi:MAG TPA: acetyl-CoA carboxylase biotin carboxyl carrier protein [Clostridiales bacterium]|nr:acetyl-CoA carboxylase biotin carboxyl carrier protein [Clostridiales bacterium]